MSIKSQKANMKAIYGLVSQDLSYIFGERESGPNGAKKQFHSKSKAFLRALGNDLGLKEFKVSSNYAGIAVSGEITLRGTWPDGSGVYFQLSQRLGDKQEFVYSSISHMKDYSSGQNQWMDADLFMVQDYETVLEMLLALRSPAAADEAATATDAIFNAGVTIKSDTKPEVVSRHAA